MTNVVVILDGFNTDSHLLLDEGYKIDIYDIDDIAGGDGSDALAADEFNNFDLDGYGLTDDTLSDIAGFNPFDDPDEIN